MSAATTAAISAATTSNIVAANAVAMSAKRKACESIVKNYQHKDATIAEMRSYADCINSMHREPLNASELYGAKFAVFFLLAAMVWGVFYERKNKIMTDSWYGNIFSGVAIGFTVGVLSLFLMAVFLLGTEFLFL